MRKCTRKYTQLGKFACKILHADYHNLRVFDLRGFLHCWLSECSCTLVWVALLAYTLYQTFERRSNVSIKLSELKVIQVFRPNEHCF